ncbi:MULTISPECIES: hypothetical protein [Bacillus]|uniref:Uncharacterized protein n=1 Tax=Bacillus cereus TaxID=1396 RepID=A0A9X0MJQ3_BACCE|nr:MULTISPECIES: hypothetical protein [Bacillus cereus group]PEZ75115.1 hypothetical protein CN410_13415 [Bacillus anthracis]KXY50955.1 hypothetical protein AT268_30895 [Bacillus cereus]PFA29306.1 hypothetical protein CN384_06075 [Bacillus thuringiensis]PFF51994.1 hypothetical protein CN357_04710 [Bacillus cereus]PGB15721.1 hypothetical protein COM09_09070 [Bacillus toyonensis]
MEYNLFTMDEHIPTQYIPPTGEYISFVTEEHYVEKCKEWGFFNAKPKKDFLYKRDNKQFVVTIAGYQESGKEKNVNTLVIQFDDGNLSCILPAFLKEMQSSNFNTKKEIISE